MDEFNLSAIALTMVQGSTQGTQPKFFRDGYWYKADVNGYEGTAEYLSTLVLQHSNATNFVPYERCLINGRPGCRCASFLAPNESFLSFERLHELSGHGSMEDAVRMISSCEERIEYVEDFVLDTCGLDVSEYLSQILTLDAITLNCDRHFNNLGVIIENETGTCKAAPIFDNGDALFSSFAKFPDGDFASNLARAAARPFSSDHLAQAVDAGIGLAVDYAGLSAALAAEKPSRAVDTLLRQLERVRDIVPDIAEVREAEKGEVDAGDGGDRM